MWLCVKKAFRELRFNFGDGCGSYRPDLHYMRGPGPKWHAKYGHLAPRDSESAAASRPPMREAAQQRA
jgi:hypothetical protein